MQKIPVRLINLPSQSRSKIKKSFFSSFADRRIENLNNPNNNKISDLVEVDYDPSFERNLFDIGLVTGVKGQRGDLKFRTSSVFFDYLNNNDFTISSLANQKIWIFKDKKIYLSKINSFDLSSKPNCINIENVRDRNFASELIDSSLKVLKFFFEDSSFSLINFEVVNKNGQSFGKIFKVERSKYQTTLFSENAIIPYVDSYVLNISVVRKTVFVDWEESW